MPIKYHQWYFQPKFACQSAPASEVDLTQLPLEHAYLVQLRRSITPSIMKEIKRLVKRHLVKSSREQWKVFVDYGHISPRVKDAGQPHQHIVVTDQWLMRRLHQESQ
jgi:hypothetical protein